VLHDPPTLLDSSNERKPPRAGTSSLGREHAAIAGCLRCFGDHASQLWPSSRLLFGSLAHHTCRIEIKANFKLREGLIVLSGLSNPLRNIEVTHARIVPNAIAGATSRLHLLMIATAMSTAVCDNSKKEGTRHWDPDSRTMRKSSYPFIHAHRFPHRTYLHSCRGRSKRGKRHPNFPWCRWTLAELPDRGARIARGLAPRPPAGVGVLFHASARGFGSSQKRLLTVYCDQLRVSSRS
jgi:hypothetical protein